jgi:hypothetical protein
MAAKSKSKAARPLTMSVPEAGKHYYDLSRNGSYAAAGRGEIPTVKVGRRLLRVPVEAMERKIEELLKRQQEAVERHHKPDLQPAA